MSQNNYLVKLIINLFGVSSLSEFWVAIDENKNVYGTTGTSDSPNEKVAQNLYEKYGFKVIKKEKKLLYTKIYMELEL